MDSKEKVNEEQARRKEGFDSPIGSFQKMSMHEAIPSDCSSMMGFGKGNETKQEQATETPSKRG
jgi:hypothetical protein